MEFEEAKKIYGKLFSKKEESPFTSSIKRVDESVDIVEQWKEQGIL